MTEKEIRELFQKVEDLRAEVLAKRADLEEQKENKMAIKAVNYERPRVSGGSHSDLAQSLERIQADLDDVIRELQEFEVRYQELLARVRALIELCPDSTQRAVLEHRYLAGLTPGQVAKAMHFSNVWIWELERRGIQAIAQRVKNT